LRIVEAESVTEIATIFLDGISRFILAAKEHYDRPRH
jgi:hypothetical protein